MVEDVITAAGPSRLRCCYGDGIFELTDAWQDEAALQQDKQRLEQEVDITVPAARISLPRIAHAPPQVEALRVKLSFEESEHLSQIEVFASCAHLRLGL